MERVCGIDVMACERCPMLVESRTQIVNGDGPMDANIVFVGEAPGADEDAQGAPFVGRSGGILDDALRTAGVSRDDVRIANSVRCRPPDNRDPLDEELANCRSYLESEIATVDPSVIVTLGKVPSEHLLGRSVAVTHEAGSRVSHRIGGVEREILICVHPAATLYDPSQRDTLEATIQTAVEFVGGGDQTTFGQF